MKTRREHPYFSCIMFIFLSEYKIFHLDKLLIFVILYIMPDIHTLIAFCAVGAEKIVSNELKKLNLTVIESGFGRVKFKSDLQGIYKALIGLRAADRVLLEAAFFDGEDFDELFDGIRETPWEEYIPPHLGIRVSKVRTNRSKLGAETSIQGVVHKAAADRLCEKRNIRRLPENRPSRRGEPEDPELRIHIEKNKVSVLLDLSGEPLFKRGYRTSGGAAPIRETTAAALILHSMWKRKFPLYDPFSGSGTIAIEAALYAWDIAPGLGRSYAVNELLIKNEKIESEVREEFWSKIDFTRLVRISGSDSDEGVVKAARSNLSRAVNLISGKERSNAAGEFEGEGRINFSVLEFRDARPDFEEGYIITNPPYGRRLGNTESAENTYREMNILAENFRGWKLGVICEHSGFESFFGRKADSCREISNGAIQTYFYQYEKL